MCGICGIINYDEKPVDKNLLEKMMKTMKHRGPDDEGIFIVNNVGLGFVRLSILDLSNAGHQPMIDESGDYILIYNGEIYNYLEIREELQKKGYNFFSKTDSEVLLKSYIEWGQECVDKFIGMWAFCIYDRKEKLLFFSRDRFGIKPLYYFIDDNKFVFCSEIKPILAIDKKAKEINYEVLYNYFITNRTNYSEQTFFTKVKKLLHSHNIIFNLEKNKFDIVRWYRIENKTIQLKYSEDELLTDLVNSIKMQLRSDVPVGISLSGGLDSSTIASIVYKILLRDDINSFSAVYDEDYKNDETKYINELSDYIKNIHFTYPTADTLYEEIYDFISFLEEPIPNTSEYAEYKVMQLASNYTTVILNGQGVDESLAGYHYFIGYFLKSKFKKLNIFDFFNQILNYYYIHKNISPFAYFLFLIQPKFIKEILLSRNSILNKEFENEYKISKNILGLYSAKNLKEAFILHFENKFEHHLLWADKTGMRFSMETRFPFLDHRIIEKWINLEENKIYNNGITKVILRNATQGIVPEKLRTRYTKVGFETPQAKWFREKNNLKSLLNNVINENDEIKSLIIIDKLKAKMIEHQNYKKDNSDILWKVLNTSLWLKIIKEF